MNVEGSSPFGTIKDEIAKVVTSLGHEFRDVTNQQEALDALKKHMPSYIITGLLLPVAHESKRKAPDNCYNFLHQARKIYTKPIIVTAPSELVIKGYGPKLVRSGAFDLVDLPAPSKGRSLNESIRDALRGWDGHELPHLFERWSKWHIQNSMIRPLSVVATT